MFLSSSACFLAPTFLLQQTKRTAACTYARNRFRGNFFKRTTLEKNVTVFRNKSLLSLNNEKVEEGKKTTPTSALSIKRDNIPMILTYCRLIAVPVLCAVGLLPIYRTQTHLAAIVFATASITDFFDGYLARRWGVVSALGTFLDPVADKIMVAVALTLISARLSHPTVILSSAIILAREIFVSALREWMALIGKSANVQVSIWGKIKTTMQMVAVTALLLAPAMNTVIAKFGTIALVISAVLTVFSAVEYIISAAKAIKEQ